MGLIGEHYMSRWEYTSYWGHVSRGRLWRSGRRHQFRSWKFLIRISQSQLDVSIVRQTEETRPIDHYKRSGVNDATAIYSKLWLPSLDHGVEIAWRKEKKTRRGASDCQNGHKNVHKQFPVIPEHRKASIIVVRNPGDGRLYRACPNQLMFGSVRVVQHYNIISRIIATSCVRVFRIPSVAYFDDYAETMKNRICKSALEAVIWITSLGSSQGPQRCDGPTSEIIGANCQFIPTMADYSARRRKNWDPPLSPGQPWTRQDGLG